MMNNEEKLKKKIFTLNWHRVRKNKFFVYIASMPPAINCVFLCAVISIILMEGWLSSIPEIFPWGNEFGKVYFKICISIISSYVFYFIVVHIKAVRDKRNINVFVEKEIKLIMKNHKLFQEIQDKEIYGEYIKSTVIFEISQIIKNIFAVMPFLDTELVKLLTEILNSKYSLSNINISDMKTNTNSRDEREYKELLEELKKYYN